MKAIEQLRYRIENTLCALKELGSRVERVESAYKAIIAERDALKAERDALKAELDRLRNAWPWEGVV